ncbi:MAG: hypothetical protein ACYCPW_03740 [Nitrososphaerales archaeon]
MISKSAISQLASTAIIMAIIVAAFSGYAVGSLSQGTTQTIYTNTQTVTQSVSFVSFVTESMSQTVTSTLTTAVENRYALYQQLTHLLVNRQAILS